MTPFERFTANEIDRIRYELEKITEFAVSHNKDNHKLVSIIDNLARIAAMFADVKAQELKGKVDIVDPQGYIEAKLVSIRHSIEAYHKEQNG